MLVTSTPLFTAAAPAHLDCTLEERGDKLVVVDTRIIQDGYTPAIEPARGAKTLRACGPVHQFLWLADRNRIRVWQARRFSSKVIDKTVSVFQRYRIKLVADADYLRWHRNWRHNELTAGSLSAIVAWTSSSGYASGLSTVAKSGKQARLLTALHWLAVDHLISPTINCWSDADEDWDWTKDLGVSLAASMGVRFVDECSKAARP